MMETDEVLFSVVMPTHARPELLAEAIESVFRQSESRWELIVVDDGSPAPATVPRDDRIRLLRRAESGGPAVARNQGISSARGRYIAFLDDDDIWGVDRLSHAAHAHESADVVVCAGGRVGSTQVSQWHHGKGAARDWILDNTTPQLGAVTVRRELCPHFDEGYRACEDLDWWLRLTDRTSSVTYIGSPDWLWRRHGGARNGIGAVNRRAGRYQLMREYADFFRAHPRARAFAWRRIGLLSQDLGEPRAAMSAALRSLLYHPTAGGARLLVKGAGGALNRWVKKRRTSGTAPAASVSEEN